MKKKVFRERYAVKEEPKVKETPKTEDKKDKKVSK